MPWSPAEASSKTKKANSPAKRKQWSATANAVRSKAMASGASEEEADGKAIRIANAAVKKRGRRH